MAVVPDARGNVTGGAVRRRLVAARGDRDRHAVLAGVAQGKTAADGDVEDGVVDQGLSVVDDLAVGAEGGVLGDRRRNQRQLDESPGGPHAVEHFEHGTRRFGPALAHVHMGIGAERDQKIGGVDHLGADVGVQVQGRDDGHVGTDESAHHGKKGAVGVRVDGGGGGAMLGDEDTVERQHRREAAFDLGQYFVEERLLDGAAGGPRGEQDGHRLPGDGLLHDRHESGNLAGIAGVGPAQFGQHGVAGDVEDLLEFLAPHHRRVAVALQAETEKRNAFHRPSLRRPASRDPPSPARPRISSTRNTWRRRWRSPR